jgi:hypothetical protein
MNKFNKTAKLPFNSTSRRFTNTAVLQIKKRSSIKNPKPTASYATKDSHLAV